MVSAGSEKQQSSPEPTLSSGAWGISPSPADPPDPNKAFQSASAMKAELNLSYWAEGCPSESSFSRQPFGRDSPSCALPQAGLEGQGLAEGKEGSAGMLQQPKQGNKAPKCFFKAPVQKKEPGNTKENKQLPPAINWLTQIQQLTLVGGAAVLAALTPLTCHPPSSAKRKQAGETARAQPHPQLLISGS